MNFDAFIDVACDRLIQLVAKKYKPLFNKLTQAERRGVYRYLFSRRPKKVPPSLRSRIVNLYDPLADRCSRFPDGLRWCVNTYVGCRHSCAYCYVNGYSPRGVGVDPRPKKRFRNGLQKDLRDLRDLAVPPAFLHISNSTDPLQRQLEERYRDTLFTLRNIAHSQELFTGVVLLTKNPAILLDGPYLEIIRTLKTFKLQVSCAFWRDKPRSFYERCAPPVEARLAALGKLAAQEISIEVRVDPLFPASHFHPSIRRHRTLPDYGLVEAQTKEDLEHLVRTARQLNAPIISSPLKIPVSSSAHQCKKLFADLFTDANDGKRIRKGTSWRLPGAYQEALLSSMANLCSAHGVVFRHCMADILNRV